jgi:hypothetical protein
MIASALCGAEETDYPPGFAAFVFNQSSTVLTPHPGLPAGEADLRRMKVGPSS